MKLVVGQVEPWTFRLACVYGAGSTLVGIAWLKREAILPSRRDWLPIATVSVFAVTGWHMLTAFGLALVGGGRAAILAFTMPLWATIFGYFLLREDISWRHLAALCVGLTGIMVLLGNSVATLHVAPWGAILILLAAVCWAVGTVGVKAVDWSIGTIALSGWLMLVGGLPIAWMWIAHGASSDLSRLTLIGTLAWLYVVFVALVFCFTSYLRIVRTVPATVAAISTLAIPVVGVVSSALLLNEPIGIIECLSLLLVCSAVALVTWPETRKPSE